MNLFRYIDKYGCYSFDEVPFGEVDNVIFSSLSYVSFDGLVAANRFLKKTIQEVGKDYFLVHSKREKNVLAVRVGLKVLRYVMDTRRYKDLLLYNYIYKINAKEQFSAVTIEINPKLVYVAFEGTDQTIGGWRENFMLSYKFPVLSQRQAIDYVNKNFMFRRKKIILGGHSKGGNLAMVAGMYANFFVREKIVQIYSNDGPGLLKEQLESSYYKNIENKFVHIIPNYSVVGLLLEHSDNYEVVRSARKSIWSHDLATWVVKDREFERAILSPYSEVLDVELDKWLSQYDQETRKNFVISLFEIFDRADIYTLVDLMKNKRLIFRLITESKEMEDETKEILKDFVSVLFRCFKDVTKEELLALFDKN